MRLVALPPDVLAALSGGRPAGGRVALGRDLPGYFVEPELRQVWRLHLDRLTDDSSGTPWGVHVAVACGLAVGHGGFHGRPDGTGTVEVGHSVDPAHRRRGHATAILCELLRRAEAAAAVARVRAVLDRGNAGSLATVAGLGFAVVGERGHEIVFEVRVDVPHRSRNGVTGTSCRRRRAAVERHAEGGERGFRPEMEFCSAAAGSAGPGGDRNATPGKCPNCDLCPYVII